MTFISCICNLLRCECDKLCYLSATDFLKIFEAYYLVESHFFLIRYTRIIRTKTLIETKSKSRNLQNPNSRYKFELLSCVKGNYIDQRSLDKNPHRAYYAVTGGMNVETALAFILDTIKCD